MVTEYTPEDIMVVGEVLALTMTDPSVENMNYQQLLERILADRKEENWSLSVEKLEDIMIKNNLFLKSTAKEFKPFTKHIFYKSDYVPTLVPGIHVTITEQCGRGLYASKKFKKGDIIWTEDPLIVAPDLKFMYFVKIGRLCRHCGERVWNIKSIIFENEDQYVRCNKCAAAWCSENCRQSDLVHDELVHGTQKPTKDKSLKAINVSCSDWELFEEFAWKNSLEHAYLYALMLVNKLKHGKDSEFAKIIEGLSYVNEEKSLESFMEPGSQKYEQKIQIRKEGYALLKKALKPSYDLSYEEYLNGIGCVSLNCLGSSICATYSLLNHNCDPNTTMVYTSGNSFHVVARRDIEPNEEICTSYVDPEDGLERRQFDLYSWGFICHCERCTREGVDDLTILL